MKTLAISALMIVLWTAAPAYAQDPLADAYGCLLYTSPSPRDS